MILYARSYQSNLSIMLKSIIFLDKKAIEFNFPFLFSFTAFHSPL